MGTILIKNGRIWNGHEFFYGDLFLENDRVAEIAPEITCKATYTYDAAGKTVTPGLVDSHVHLWGISPDKYGTPESTCFPFGVTAAVEAGATKGTKERLDAMMLKTGVFVNTWIRDNQWDIPRTEALLDQLGESVLGIKVYFSEPNVQDTAPLAEVCRYAREKNLMVMVHCTDSPRPMAEILQTLSPGDILTHAFHGGQNHAAEDGFASLKAAQNRGVVIDAGFAGHVHTDFAVLKSAVEQGVVPDIISTDITKGSAFKRGGRYGLTMCMTMAKAVGYSEEAIFRAVTSTPAKVFHKEEWGCLKPGGKADVAVLDYRAEGFCLTDKAGNTLESKDGYRCVLTTSNGEVVYRD